MSSRAMAAPRSRFGAVPDQVSSSRQVHPGAVSPAPEVSVVIPVRNGEGVIGACLKSVVESLRRFDRRCEVIVVDNGSEDRTAEIADGYPVMVVQEPEPGVSNARNRGIANSRAPIVCFLDADCVVDPDWLRRMVEAFDDPVVGCVGGGLGHGPIETGAQRQAARILGRWQDFGVVSDPPYVVTANAAFRRWILDEIGGFDPRMVRAQDVEISLRYNRVAERDQLEMRYVPAALARHTHRRTWRGFYEQQRGWAYGAGLCAAKLEAQGGTRATTAGLSSVWPQLKGFLLVCFMRLRGRGEPGYLEEAWANLLRQYGWVTGGRKGVSRGRRIFASDPWAPAGPPIV